MLIPAVLLSLLATFSHNVALADHSAEDCWSLGFNKANLLCSSCDHMTGMDVIKNLCKECCAPDEQTNEQKRFAKAILEVCTCKFGTYPQIQAFIKSDKPSQFANLQIKYVRGLDPIIKLLDKDGHVRETLAIDKWNTDSVEEFLRTHLEDENGNNGSNNRDYLETNQV